MLKNSVIRIGEKKTETRPLTSDIPTHNTVHFYNPTSLCDMLCAPAYGNAQSEVGL